MAKNIVPNLHRLINSEHSLYASRMKSQAKQGASGDGQLTTMTGLLPLNSGAVCLLYGDNKYPNLAHFFDRSYTMTSNPEAWNKSGIHPNYGIKDVVTTGSEAIDEVLFEKSLKTILSGKGSYFQLILTDASHSPFDADKYADITLPQDMPDVLTRYARCVHYTDSCIGALVKKIDLNKTTLVIAGDHTIFKQSMLKDFSDFATKYNISIASHTNYIPFIVHSPHIPHHINITDQCMQMDIYPTLSAIIGCKTYYWQGMGVDLTHPSALSDRRISEQQAYQLSTKLIVNDYFNYTNSK